MSMCIAWNGQWPSYTVSGRTLNLTHSLTHFVWSQSYMSHYHMAFDSLLSTMW